MRHDRVSHDQRFYLHSLLPNLLDPDGPSRGPAKFNSGVYCQPAGHWCRLNVYAESISLGSAQACKITALIVGLSEAIRRG